MIPPLTIPEKHLTTIIEYTQKIAKQLHVIGLMNIQYAIYEEVVYILEANPRASRTVPLVSKVCNIPMASLATQVIMANNKDQRTSIISNFKPRQIKHYGVKESVFPFNKFPEVDPVLGPEMRSTGEVLGIADTFGMAYFKAQEGTQSSLPLAGTVLMSIAEDDRSPIVVKIAIEFLKIGFKIKATRGTQEFLKQNGIEAELIYKINESRPNIIDEIMNGDIQLVVNTPIGKHSVKDDSYIRKTAIKKKIAYITTTPAALASAKGIAAYIEDTANKTLVKSLQEYHAEIN